MKNKIDKKGLFVAIIIILSVLFLFVLSMYLDSVTPEGTYTNPKGTIIVD